MISANELKGILGMMPAFATPDATDIRATQTIAVDNLKEGVDKIIKDGVHNIATTGTYGECYSLLFDEFKTLAEATVDAVKKKGAALHRRDQSKPTRSGSEDEFRQGPRRRRRSPRCSLLRASSCAGRGQVLSRHCRLISEAQYCCLSQPRQSQIYNSRCSIHGAG